MTIIYRNLLSKCASPSHTVTAPYVNEPIFTDPCEESALKAMIPILIVLWTSLDSSPAVAQTCPPGSPRIAPDSRYRDHGDGTVTDLQTRLMWKRCSEGQSGTACSGTASGQAWQVALTTAANSTFAGYNDWRLPSVKELYSLVETGCHEPSINSVRFPNTPIRFFWTSTTSSPSAPNVPDGSFALNIYFGYGNIGNGFSKSVDLGVRLVRGGD